MRSCARSGSSSSRCWVRRIACLRLCAGFSTRMKGPKLVRVFRFVVLQRRAHGEAEVGVFGRCIPPTEIANEL